MNKRLSKSYSNFFEYFGYTPNYPYMVDFNQNEYAELLDRCIEDDFDYTIERYGTNPVRGTEPHEGVYID